MTKPALPTPRTIPNSDILEASDLTTNNLNSGADNVLPMIWENSSRDVFITIAADLPALQLRAGQNVTLRPVAAIDADAVFAFQDGSLARVQTLFNGTYRVTDSEGVLTIISRTDMIPVFARLIYGPN